MDFSITLDATGDELVKSSVEVGSTENRQDFDLTRLKPAMTPYNVILTGTVNGRSTQYTTTTELLYLPDKKPGEGSITKIDHLNGGMLFKNAASGNKFAPFFGWGFYSGYDNFLGANDSIALIDKYVAWGLNAMTPLTQYPQSAKEFAHMDEINLRYQYNLREGYKNLTWVEENVKAARNNEAIFSYWSSDECVPFPLSLNFPS